MIWSALVKVATVIGRGIYYTLGGVQAAGELLGATKRLAREARGVDDTEPIPLSHREAVRIQRQIDCAARPADSRTPPGCPPPRPPRAPRSN